MDLQMGLAETMKNIAKGIQTEINNAPFNGVGYVTEKLYMLLQLYIQNKGWNPSVELLQCFTELKEAAMLPSASYLQMLASRVTLDSQGRLILRENGKIILPYEHFANAVMLKHMNGPHGLHLNIEATVRAVMDSYTIGRDEFGMEKEFIVEVVQNCPNPTCRFYKSQLSGTSSSTTSHSKGNSFGNDLHSSKVSTPHASSTPTNVNSIPPSGKTDASLPSSGGGSNTSSLLSLPIDLTNVFEANLRSVMAGGDLAKLNAAVKSGGRSGLSITRTSSSDILQQAIRNEVNNRNRLIENENRRQLEAENRRLGNETRRLEKETRRIEEARLSSSSSSNAGGNLTISLGGNTISANSHSGNNSGNSLTGNNSGGNVNNLGGMSNNGTANANTTVSDVDDLNSVSSHKLSDFLKANIESLDTLNKDLLAAHSGTWSSVTSPGEEPSPSKPRGRPPTGQEQQDQEKIVRAFSEIMKNMGRMKTCIRPSMCKPYGKQSETLQKTLVDTIQLVQSLRSFLPPPHIAVSSWKNEDKGVASGNQNQIGLTSTSMGSLSNVGLSSLNNNLGGSNASLNLSNIQVSAASLAAAAAVANRKPPSGGMLNSGKTTAGGLLNSGAMSLSTAAQIVSGSNLEELVEAVRAQQKAMASGE